MLTTATFSKPARIINDVLPASPKKFVLFAVGFSFLFRAAGYLLSGNAPAINASHDWIYHAFWLPLHLFLARYGAIAFSHNVDACLAFSNETVRRELEHRVQGIISFRGWAVSMLLVAPFVFLDAVAAAGYIHENFEEQRYAATLIPAIWLIEWLATAQIWLYVLGSIYFNSLVLNERNIIGRHEGILLSGEMRTPLLCGLESAFITLVYGLSTIGYVWYANGQVSDYLVLAISTVLVLICFFTALLQLKGSLRESLDIESQRYRVLLATLHAQSGTGGRDGDAAGTSLLPYADFKEAVSMVFERKAAKDVKLEERLRGIKLATLLAVPPASAGMDRTVYAQALMLIECETRLADFGIGEIKALSLRAVMPIFLILGKSAGGLFGTH